MPKKTIKLNSFFSGIGGFDIAFERNGFATQMMCEINPFCNDILAKHWPKVQKFSDINNLTLSDIPNADVWCGGFPCQDISLARGSSKRLGLHGSRSGLFYQFADLIKQGKPQVVLIENVGGLFNSNQGRDFGTIIQTMSSLGYNIAWRLLNSRYFGVPQSRTRVYICCWRGNGAKALKVMFDNAGAPKPTDERKDFLTESNPVGSTIKVPTVAYCLAASSGRHTGTDWSRTYVVNPKGVRRLSPIESERLQGFPDRWTELPDYSSNKENSDTLRYTAIGNAVSVPVIEWIARRIYVELQDNTKSTIEDTVVKYHDFDKRIWNDVNIHDIDFTDENLSHKWRKGGIVENGRVLECDAYPTPLKVKRTVLFALVEEDQNNSLYYLTPNAAEGILRRVDGQNRHLFPPLRDALEQLKSQKK